MLLRRVMENVNDQNWFAVALDFGIVVGGILLAFQLQTWGEERAVSERAQQSLVQLYQESEEILDDWTSAVELYDRSIEIQDRVVAALHSGDRSGVNDEELQRALSTITHFPTISPPRRTYDELRNAGLLREINAPEALSKVSEYYEQHEFIQGQIVFFRPDSTDQLRLRYGRGMNSHYDATNLTRRRIEIDFDSLAADPLYLDAVSDMLRNLIIFQFYRRGTMHIAAEMCTALAEAVGETCQAYAAYEEWRELPEWQMRNVPPREDRE